VLKEEPVHTSSMTATANDLRDLVRILKKRTDGLSLTEAMDAFKKRILNPQKIAIYEYWGMILRDGNHLGLSPLGWELAQRLEHQVPVFRTMLGSIPLYRSVLEWIHDYSLYHIIHPDVISYWEKHHPEIIRASHKDNIKVNAVSFFHLCHAAEVGTVILGKRGHPARLLIDREELEQHLRVASSPAPTTSGAMLPRSKKPSVFISCVNNSPVVEQVQAALALAECESEVSERGKTEPTLMAERMRLAARRSVAGIIVLTADDSGSDEGCSCRHNETVAMVIGAACALCDNRVVLLREKGFAAPSYLAALKQCEFQGSSLSWESGVQLMQAIREVIGSR
jgi:Predicted nucleotide-binding protein containing TIR-like domain